MKKKIITVIVIISFIVTLILMNTILNKHNEQKTKNIYYSEKREEKKMEVIKVTSQNFKKEVLQSEKPVLVDFYADWCGPCKMLAPIMKEVAKENEDIKVVKINIDQAQDLAEKYDVMSIPTVVAIKNGQEINRNIGYTRKETILNMIR